MLCGGRFEVDGVAASHGMAKSIMYRIKFRERKWGAHLGVKVADVHVLELGLQSILRQRVDHLHGRSDRACCTDK